MRAIKLEKNMVFEFTDLPNQIKYHKQSNIHVGDLLFVLDGEIKLCHSIDVKVPPTPPMASFVVDMIEYKSRLHKFFRKFLREPIKMIRVSCLAVME